MRRLFISIASACLIFCCAPAGAQSTAEVVATCGTPPAIRTAGSVRTLTQNPAGQLCGAAAVSGGGDASAANQTLQITQETAFNTALGLMADAACATDNGTCALLALVKRGNQRLTTLNTTLGTPFQAGGSIANTSFGATQATAANLNATVVGTGTFATQSAITAASGSVASGAYASGSIASGAMVDLGAIADAAATAGSTGSLSAKARLMTSQLDTTNTDLGPPGATACATDTGSCSLNALLQRIAQRLSTSITNQTTDPCAYATKTQAQITVTSATTTQLVAISGSTTIYVCGFAVTIAPSLTSSDTFNFVYGTGSSCGTGTTGITGTYGNGSVTAGTVVPISYGNGGNTIFRTLATGQALCTTTAGTTVNLQGVLTYVQQ